MIQSSPRAYRARSGLVPNATTAALARAQQASEAVIRMRDTWPTILGPSAGRERSRSREPGTGARYGDRRSRRPIVTGARPALRIGKLARSEGSTGAARTGMRRD